MILNSKSKYLQNCITNEEFQEELLKTEVEKFKKIVKARRAGNNTFQKAGWLGESGSACGM